MIGINTQWKMDWMMDGVHAMHLRADLPEAPPYPTRAHQFMHSIALPCATQGNRLHCLSYPSLNPLRLTIPLLPTHTTFTDSGYPN